MADRESSSEIRNNVNLGESYWGGKISYKKVEALRDCRWVADLCLRNRDGGWTEIPASVFYQPKKSDPSHSYYFGLTFDPMLLLNGEYRLLITSAQSAAEGVWSGVRNQTGEIVFSRYRHDFRAASSGGPAVDGGRDYTRIVGEMDNCSPVTLRITGSAFSVMPGPDATAAVFEDEIAVAKCDIFNRHCVQSSINEWMMLPGSDQRGNVLKVIFDREVMENTSRYDWITDAVVRFTNREDFDRYREKFA